MSTVASGNVAPYVGRPGRYDNLCVAAGHAMLGVSLGPITGRLVAEVEDCFDAFRGREPFGVRA